MHFSHRLACYLLLPALALAGLSAIARPALARGSGGIPGFESDGGFGAGAPITIKAIEAGFLALTDDEFGGYFSVMLTSKEWSLGYEGQILDQDRPVTDPNEQTAQLHRFFVGFDFLEVYWDAILSIEFGYAFGEALTNGGFGGLDAGLHMGLPMIDGPDGFPILRADVNYSFRPLERPTDHFQVNTRFSVYPFPGGPLRPFGVQLGYRFGEIEGRAFNAVVLGLTFGARLPSGHERD